MRRLLREPLLHFLALGALLFVVFALVNDDETPGDGRRIRVGPDEIVRLQAQFQRQWQRSPSGEELEGLIQAHVREEVLYREALGLGLDEGDTIVRRRLAQKMEFLITDATPPAEPDTATLQAYFEAHAERYQEPPLLTFRHIYFSRDRRGSRATQDAEALLSRLRGRRATPVRLDEVGDRLMVPSSYTRAPLPDIARDFGGAFADRLVELEPGQWQGPVESGYGLHLVSVSERVEVRVPPFETVRRRVETDYLDERRQELNELAYQKVQDQYEIEVDRASTSR